MIWYGLILIFLAELNAVSINATDTKCGPDCSLVRCALPTCQPGYELYKDPKECCYKCVPVVEECPPTACHTVKCGVRGDCPLGQVEAMGGYCNCCRICKEDCRLVLCESIKNCPSGQKKVRKGCCDICVNIDDISPEDEKKEDA